VIGSVRVCFVCLGNICRSPTAEAVFRDLVAQADPPVAVEVDSAGTARYHLGDLSDPRARAVAGRRGLVMDHRARQFTAAELDDWDLVVAMDRHNLRDLQALLRTPEQRERIVLLRAFDAAAHARGELDVPDPYYGDEAEFVEALEIIEAGCAGLLAHLQEGSSEARSA
jgi:protein-tyrosine phosphatase